MRAIVVVLGVFGHLASAAPAPAQTVKPLELGVQFSAMRLGGVDATDAGFGGRVTWNLSDLLALEAAGDFFPSHKFDVVRGGRKAIAVAGPKLTARWHRLGVFGKARAGVGRVGEGRSFGACIAVFPPPEGCYDAENRVAFDLGGGIELYPSAGATIRVDAGALLTRLGESSQRFGRDGSYARDLQFSAGVGVRF